MGIEPTQDARTPRNGFEDRGAHQDSSASSIVFFGYLFNMSINILPASKKSSMAAEPALRNKQRPALYRTGLCLF